MAALLRAEGLTRYYSLADGTLSPVGAAPSVRGHAWLEPLLAATGDGALASIELDVQGIHCAACVWLMNETFRRSPGAVTITVNPALGKARLAWTRGQFDLPAWIAAVERFGYQFGPSRKRASAAADSVTWRLGIVAALTMNVMLFSLSFYFGLSARDGDLYVLFSRLALVLSTAVVVIGGWPFLRSAVRGLQQRILHLDLPIALGIALVYGTSLVAVARGRDGALTYFDTMNVFITLMLLGRFLQQRVLQRNRQLLLADDGAEGLFVRRLTGAAGGLEVVGAAQVHERDRLLIAPGELVPVDADLTDATARVSTDWITGEAEARALIVGARVPAGSFNAGATAFTVAAVQDFAASPLVALLRQTVAAQGEGQAPRAGAARHLRFWDRLARRWVLTVLAVSATGLVAWLPRGPARALDVAVALLVVTCPCAIGIALPLAYEIVQARLRRAGFFVRTSDLLDRLERVQKLVFDKTGTLTLQRLALVRDPAFDALSSQLRDIAYNLACRSAHPVSACVAGALARAGAAYDPEAAVVEHAGRGLEWRRADGLWRLGRGDWAVASSPTPRPGTLLTCDGAIRATFTTGEALRTGAAAELAALRDSGYQIHLISGDASARVAALAETLGIPAAQALAGRSPADKAADLARLGGDDALFLGDGANDALAFGQALCAGTVAIERPILPGRSDFFMVGESLAPLRTALEAARQLRAVVRAVLGVSIAYNVVAVSTCLAGLMSPVRAAIFMPLSSLSILLFTVFALQPRAPRRPATLPRAVEALS